MCSIMGYYALNGANKGPAALPSPDFIPKGFAAMRHRGPDAEKEIAYRDGSIVLAHQRLSIIDTRSVSNQPMETGQSSIIFNGEIYNYLELKEELSKKYSDITFSTSSDTEVLLKGLEREGISFLNRTNGMFAFALFDKKTGEMILARDRFGVKPLHYMEQDGVLYFSSEIKPLIQIKKGLKKNLRIYESFLKDTATDFDDQTFIENIFQVKAGEYLTCTAQGFSKKIWYRGNDFSFDEDIFSNKKKTVDFAEDLLANAIDIRLRTNVPLCITLSGGLDSSTIYTLIKEKLHKKITPLTFMHSNSDIDESELAKKLVAPYGDNIIFAKADDASSVSDMQKALSSLEFPIWNPSAVAYREMFSLVKKSGFTVVVEGHGSDEQLGGYPYMIRSAFHEMLKKGKYMKAFGIARVLQKTANASLGQKFSLPYLFKSGLAEARKPDQPSNNLNMALDDAFNYKILPIVLRAFDRLTMASALESRCPFMDYRVVEFFRKLPLEYKVSSIGSKAILREILKKYNKDFIYKTKRKLGFASDIPKLLNDPVMKQFITESINSFAMPEFKMYAEQAKKDAGGTLGWKNMETAWKIASLSYINKTYGI